MAGSKAETEEQRGMMRRAAQAMTSRKHRQKEGAGVMHITRPIPGASCRTAHPAMYATVG